jgi:hypothetical protein
MAQIIHTKEVVEPECTEALAEGLRQRPLIAQDDAFDDPTPFSVEARRN